MRNEGDSREAKRVEALSLFDVKGDEGESERALGVGVSVMEWTGPGVWTDSVMSYLRAEYGISWPIFKDLHREYALGRYRCPAREHSTEPARSFSSQARSESVRSPSCL